MGNSGGTFGRLIIESGSVNIDVGKIFLFLFRDFCNSKGELAKQ